MPRTSEDSTGQALAEVGKMSKRTEAKVCLYAGSQCLPLREMHGGDAMMMTMASCWVPALVLERMDPKVA